MNIKRGPNGTNFLKDASWDLNMSFVSTLASTLRTQGYPATFFSSPANALAAARSKAPDLLKSNVSMPKPVESHKRIRPQARLTLPY